MTGIYVGDTGRIAENIRSYVFTGLSLLTTYVLHMRTGYALLTQESPLLGYSQN